MIELSRHRTR